MPPRGPAPWSLGRFQPPLGSRVNPAHPLARGLIGAWLLNEAAGLVAVNAVTGKAGLLGGTTNPGWVPSPWGSAVRFNGVGQRVATGLTVPAPPFTLATRMRRPGGQTGTLIGQSTGTGIQWRLDSRSRLLKAEVADMGSSATNIPGVSTWYYLVVTYDGTNIAFYTNGRADGTASSVQTFSAGAFYLGQRPSPGEDFNGHMDHAMVWNRVLSAREVATLYADPYALFDAPAPLLPLLYGHAAFMPEPPPANPVPTVVGAGTVAYTATNNAPIAPGLPTDWAADDIGVLIFGRSDNIAPTAPSGWTEILAANQNNTAALQARVYVRRLVAGDPAPSIAGTSTTVRGARIIAIRGVPTDGTAESWITASRSNNAASATITWLSVMPSQDNCRLLAFYVYEDDPASVTGMLPAQSWVFPDPSPSTLGNDMTIGWTHQAWADGSVATGNYTTTAISGTFTNSPNTGILLAIAPGMPVPLVVDTPQASVGTVTSQSLVLPPSVVEVAASTSVVATVGVTPSITSVVATTSVSLALSTGTTAAVSVSQSLLYSPIVTPSVTSVTSVTSVSLKLTITPALLTAAATTAQSLALRVTPLTAAPAASIRQSLALSARTEVVTSTDVTAIISPSTNTTVTDVAAAASSVSVSLGLAPRVSSAYRAPSITYSITSPPVTDLVSVGASTSSSLGLSASVEVAASVADPAVSRGVTAAVTAAASTSIAVALAMVPVAASAVVVTSVSLKIAVEAAVVAASTDALVTVVIVPGAATVAAEAVDPRVGTVIPATLAEVMAEVIDPSLVWRGRYRLAGTIRLVRPVTGTLSARPRV